MLPIIFIKGCAEERGFQHGKKLRREIHQVIQFYQQVFQKNQEDIFKEAEHFKVKIKEYNCKYAQEIEALAEGANVNPLWIYALNSRTEILSYYPFECTSIYFQKTGILGQNWDWAKALEGLIVLMKIQFPNGHKILMLTEPGIIGKIGMNCRGLGVCLNLLMIKKKLTGVPIHILLRSVLDSETITDAHNKLKKAGLGQASNILIGTGIGECLNIEFAGDELFYLQPEKQVLIHTNHFLANSINPKSGIFTSSYLRLETIKNKLRKESKYSLEKMEEILLDRSNQEYPIHQPYIYYPVIGDLGTIYTAIMDLKNLTIYIKSGNNLKRNFFKIFFVTYI
jgi:isopenicillin-N N-acyltransferase-like protein